MRILAIDDEPCLLRLYKRALRRHEVIAVGPDEALSLVTEDNAFDVVICDFNLPRQDGVWFHERLVQMAQGIADRLIFCTGGGVDSEGWQILEATPQRVVYKPFDASALRDAIEQVKFLPPRPEA